MKPGRNPWSQTVDKLGAGIIPAPFFPLKLNCIQKFLRNLRFCPFSNPFLPRNYVDHSQMWEGLADSSYFYLLEVFSHVPVGLH